MHIFVFIDALGLFSNTKGLGAPRPFQIPNSHGTRVVVWGLGGCETQFPWDARRVLCGLQLSDGKTRPTLPFERASHTHKKKEGGRPVKLRGLYKPKCF